jgi:TolB protein
VVHLGWSKSDRQCAACKVPGIGYRVLAGEGAVLAATLAPEVGITSMDLRPPWWNRCDPELSRALRLEAWIVAAALVIVASASAATGTAPVPLHEHTGRAPAWHPDGSRIAFESEVGGGWQVCLLEVATQVVECRPGLAGDERFPSWSPDGRSLVFACAAEPGAGGICLDDAATARPRRLVTLPGEVLWPAFNADGTQLVFTRKRGDAFAIETLALDAPETTPEILDRDGRWPRWSPDGALLAFFSRRATNGENDEIFVLERGSGVVQRLTDRPGHDFCPAWSPDGKRLVVVSLEPDGTRMLRALDREGRELERLGRGFHRITEPSWSPDGRSVVFAGMPSESDPYRLYLEVVGGR